MLSVKREQRDAVIAIMREFSRELQQAFVNGEAKRIEVLEQIWYLQGVLQAIEESADFSTKPKDDFRLSMVERKRVLQIAGRAIYKKQL